MSRIQRAFRKLPEAEAREHLPPPSYAAKQATKNEKIDTYNSCV